MNWVLVAVAFVAGYTLAHFSPFRLTVERNEPTVPARLVSSNPRLATVVIAFALMTITSITAFVRADQASDDLRDSVICFSKYNQEFAQASLARTEATAERDEARSDYDAAVQEFLTSATALIAPGNPSDEELQRAQIAAANYNTAAAELRSSTAQLNKARKDQPYPEYPTDFCAPENSER